LVNFYKDKIEMMCRALPACHIILTKFVWHIEVLMNIVEKILSGHLVDGTLGMVPSLDAEVGISIDQVLTQDTSGPMAFLQFMAMDLPKVKAKRVLTIIDHQTIQDGFENADDHAFLRSVADHYGAVYSPAGNGICHQLIVERFSQPGWTMLGTDSHTPTAGGVGMLAIGAGGLDIAVSMGGSPFYMPMPKVTQVYLRGCLTPWASAKDVILELLRRLTVKGNVGTILEYAGEGVTSLSVPERATICNMGTESGVTTSIFPSDVVTRDFLRAQSRENDWVELAADTDAAYDCTIEIDLSSVRPMVAKPHSPGNVVSLAELAAEEPVHVDQVLIGSCTNSSFRDLMVAAGLLKGRKVKPGVSLGIAPGSRQVLHMIAKNGALADLIASGARILESACGFCAGAGQSPGSGAVTVRTSNRNFKGRSGTQDALCYLVSPESAAVAAITGILADPSQSGFTLPDISTPAAYFVDDAIFEYPTFKAEPILGPNFGGPPNPPTPDRELRGTVAAVFGDNITTDHILPLGSLMKYRSNIPKYSEYVFFEIDPEFVSRCKKIKSGCRGAVIVGGFSYGQGSSREHAAICPMFLGVRAVLAKSMERIHRANLINFGILPLSFTNPNDHASIQQGDELDLVDIEPLIASGVGVIHNTTQGKEIAVCMPLSERQKIILRHGGILRWVRDSHS
jgi:aconitate hydratase